MIETLFNLGWFRPEANLRQENLSLKHFGSAPILYVLEFKYKIRALGAIFFFSVKKKYGRLTDI